MSFTFIHTADWQLGKPFARFPADVGATLRAARLDAIDRIAEEAQKAGAGHVLVAGDVIDHELIDDAALRQPLARMAAYQSLAWHLLPGNHDPSRPGGIWQRVATLGSPPNVQLQLAAEARQIAPGVALLPAPLTAKAMRTDPTAWMSRAETAEGALRIGLAHGSVQGFGSLGEAAVPIDATRRKDAGLDYLALGDWHGMKKVAAGVWYSGTPEPDSFVDNASGHALVVRIAGRGAEPEVRAVQTARHRWLEHRQSLTRAADVDRLELEIAQHGASRRNLVLSLTLDGALSSGEAVALDERIERIAAMVLAVQVDRSALRVLVDAADAAALDDPVLARVAARLRARGGPMGEAPEAAHAMRLLLSLAGAAQGGVKL